MIRRATMTEERPRASADPLTDEALAWLVRLNSGDETPDDWDAYAAWKAANPRHLAAAQRAERLWHRLGPALNAKRTRRNVTGALLLVACLGGLGAVGGVFGPLSGWLADEATGIGERRIVTLADGSLVTLDALSSFDIAYSAGERRIVLRDGQIFVAVASDPARPFVVEARRGAIRALGTAFNVRADEDGAQVAVKEHAVRVNYGPQSSVELRQGEGVRYHRISGLEKPTAVDIASLTAWRQGEILFDNRPLGEVAQEFGRYQRGTVIFTDAALKNLPVTGAFTTQDAAAFFAALELILPVKVTRLPWLTLIQHGPAGKTVPPRSPQ